MSVHRLYSPRSPFGPDPLDRAILVAGLARLIGFPGLWQRRRRYRAELKHLLLIGPHMVDDIGLTVGRATAEARKPFWLA